MQYLHFTYFLGWRASFFFYFYSFSLFFFTLCMSLSPFSGLFRVVGVSVNTSLSSCLTGTELLSPCRSVCLPVCLCELVACLPVCLPNSAFLKITCSISGKSTVFVLVCLSVITVSVPLLGDLYVPTVYVIR